MYKKGATKSKRLQFSEGMHHKLIYVTVQDYKSQHMIHNRRSLVQSRCYLSLFIFAAYKRMIMCVL